MNPNRSLMVFFALLFCALMTAAGCGEDKKSDSTPAPSCTPGELGCECTNGACNEGLTCTNNICTNEGVAPNNNAPNNNAPNNNTPNNNAPNNNTPNNNAPVEGFGLEIPDTNARACETVVVDPDKKISEVNFADGVEGKFMRRGERLAIAFIQKSDAAIGAGSVGFTLSEGTTALEGVSIHTGECFDAEGKSIESATVNLMTP